MSLTGYLTEAFVSFQGEGAQAGRRQLFIRFAGCNLRCRYCDTPGSLQRGAHFRLHRAGEPVDEVPNPVTASDLLAHVAPMVEAEGPIDGVALTGGEPLLQAEFLAQLLSGGRLAGPRLLETGGVLPDRLAVVLPWIDVVSMDIKLPSNTGEPAFWDAHARFLGLARGKAYVKIPVDAGTLVAEVEQAAQLVRSTAPETSVFLQPISAAGACIDTSPPHLTAFFRAARRHIDDVRVLPQSHKALGIR